MKTMRVLITGGSGFIGTNLMDELLKKDIPLINLDIQHPKKNTHQPYWKQCDILEFDLTHQLFLEFKPTHIVHLAARTDTLSWKLDDYRANFDGTANILRCIQMTSSVKRVIITSSQFVVAPPGLPSNDEEYNPIGAYGLSKVMAEKMARSADLSCTWTITRPTNIWGPWHPRYPNEFWLVLKRGYYFQPSGKSAIRSYGYVRNIVNQMLMILQADPSLVSGKVYYLGDPPIRLVDWTNGFSMAISGRPVRVIPRVLIASIAAVGSLLAAVGIPFPITWSRYRSMTEDYFSPMGTTIDAFGTPPYSLQQGIQETVIWLNSYWNGEFTQKS